MNDDEALAALRAEFDREPGLARASADEIWARARIAEVLAGDRSRPIHRLLGIVQLFTLDAVVAALIWSILGAAPVVSLFGLTLSKVLVVALAAAIAHATATLRGVLSAAQS